MFETCNLTVPRSPLSAGELKACPVAQRREWRNRNRVGNHEDAVGIVRGAGDRGRRGPEIRDGHAGH